MYNLPKKKAMISILLVEDQNTILQLLKTYLEQEPDLEVVGVAVDGKEALSKIEELQPNVVLMDIEMPKLDGLSATKLISQRFPQTKVLILSTHDEDRYLNDALEVGAKGYLLKNTPPQELSNTVRAVDKGYFQLGPGVLKKSSPQSSLIRSEQPSQFINRREPRQLLQTNSPSSSPPEIPLRNYLGLGFVLNAVVWTLTLAYLKFTAPTYTSEWGVKILETEPGVEVVLPDGGKATSVPRGWSPPSSQDPRNDYVYIATSAKVLEKAANLMSLSAEDFDEPEITVDQENGIIDFSMTGTSPKKAQQKALAFHEVMTKQIEALRTSEIERQEQETQSTLESARQKLTIAQKKLSEYRAISGISSEEQVQNLAANIESLRQQQAELIAQQKGLGSRYVELSNSFKQLSSSDAEDAYKLKTNSVYKQYLEEYAQAQRDVTHLSARFTPEHPVLVDKKEQLEAASAALQKQASSILGRSISLEAIAKITPLNANSQSKLDREDLLKDVVANRAEWQQLVAQNIELEAQITQLEKRLKNLSQKQFQVDSLERDLQVAEAIFATTLAKLDLGKENIYSIYPPIQLVTEPTIPEKPTTPSTTSAALSGLAGSFLINTGLILLWFDRQKFRFDRSATEEQLPSSISSVL